MHRRTFLAFPLAAAAASRTLYSRLLASLESVHAIDTHEHLLAEKDRVAQPVDFFTLGSHYVNNDVISAGLPRPDQELFSRPDSTEDQKWNAFAPYWRYAKYTGYGEALRIAMRDIYGFPEINRAVLTKMNQAIADRNKPGLYEEILLRRARLRFAVNDEYWQAGPEPVDSRYFVLARKFDWLLTPITPGGLGRIEKFANTSAGSIKDLKNILEKQFAIALSNGMVTVKSTMAYERDLEFGEVSEPDADRDLQRLRRGEEPVPEGYRRLLHRPYRNLSDHMFHYLVQLADAHRVPVQIHTGMHAGNANIVSNSRPTLLTNLFYLYPRVAFDLFHIGYPYFHDTAVLAKTFPNVHVDFCWTHIVSPSVSRAALHEMLDMVPANKIFGFGGDYRYPELSYAHLVMARRNIAAVLSERVQARNCTEEEAAELGKWLLHDNPARLFSPRKA